MANSREIRRRIKSVASIGQMTRAMELVAAAKMRRAQDTTLASRRYVQTMYQMLSNILPTVEPGSHPLLQKPHHQLDNQAKTLIIVFGPDRGLTGSLPTNLIRKVTQYQKDHPHTQLLTMGKRTRDGLIKLKSQVLADFPMVEKPRLGDIVALAKVATEEFLSGRVDQVVIAKATFYSTLRQEPEISQLLPLSSQLLKSEIGSDLQHDDQDECDFLFEPSAQVLLDQLLPRFIEMTIYQALLEAQASEYSAQMMAMKNAGDNAKELQEELTLTFNQIRQASITAELAEIAAGSGQ